MQCSWDSKWNRTKRDADLSSTDLPYAKYQGNRTKLVIICEHRKCDSFIQGLKETVAG
jgi:hypothetical protein